MKNITDKTIEQLEGVVYPLITDNTRLVNTISVLRKKPLKDYTIEDLRISIGQNVGLPYLIPVAIERLSKNILAEGDFYEGDLLSSVLTADRNFWQENKELWKTICSLYEKNKHIFSSNAGNEFRPINKAYEDFLLIHPHD